MDTLHDPRHDTRLRECPECLGEGEVFLETEMLGTVGGTCGVCLGDRYVWKDGEAPVEHGNRFVDHSWQGHTCTRCTPSEPAHLRREHSPRGFGSYPPILDTYQAVRVRVYESSAADGPHIWIALDALTPGVEEHRAAHLPREQATQLAEQIEHACEHHYQGA